VVVTITRRSDARKGRQPSAPDETRPHESAESKQMEQAEEAGGADEPGEEGPASIRRGSKKDYRGRVSPGRKRNVPGSENTKAPMDSDCGCGGTKGKKGGCSCGGKKDGDTSRGPGELYAPSTAPIRQKNARDGSCGMRRGDSLTVHEYLAACDLGIQNQPSSYIRARHDAAERRDLKCGRGAIRQGQKCTKGTAQQVNPQVQAARNIQAKQAKTGSFIEFSSYNKRTGALRPEGPSVGTQLGQAAKGVGLGVLEAGKWVSGYNLGKTIASGVTQGKNEKASFGTKAATILGTTLLLNPIAGVGAARRFSRNNDLKQHAANQKKERAWRRSVGYRDSIWAQGFQP
jgi:hypothetical protein